MKGYDPVEAAKRLRPRMIDLEAKKVLLASFSDTGQSRDFSNGKSPGIALESQGTFAENPEGDFWQ